MNNWRLTMTAIAKKKKSISKKQNINLLKKKILKEIQWRNEYRTADEWGLMKHLSSNKFLLLSKSQTKKYNLLSLSEQMDYVDKFGTQFTLNSHKNHKVDKNIVFSKLSTRQRKKQFNEIKKYIKQKMYGVGNGLFFTEHVCCDENGNYNSEFANEELLSDDFSELTKIHARYHSWMDFYFPSKIHKNVFYNATITTSYQDATEVIRDYQHALKQINNPKDNTNINARFKDLDLNEFYNENIEIYPYIMKNDYFHGYVKKNNNYCYGIGLHVRIANKKYLTVEDIEQFIIDFYENEEKEINVETYKLFQSSNNITLIKENESKITQTNPIQTEVVGKLDFDFINKVKLGNEDVQNCFEQIQKVTKEITTIQDKQKKLNRCFNNHIYKLLLSYMATVMLKNNNSLGDKKNITQFYMSLTMSKNGASKYYNDLMNINIEDVVETCKQLNIFDEFKDALDWWEKNTSNLSGNNLQKIQNILDSEKDMNQYIFKVIFAFGLTCGYTSNVAQSDKHIFKSIWNNDYHQCIQQCLTYPVSHEVQNIYEEMTTDQLSGCFGFLKSDLNHEFESFKQSLQDISLSYSNQQDDKQLLLDLDNQLKQLLQEYQMLMQ